jgi:hypothetical protein
MSPSAARKQILKIENDLIRGNKLFCANHNIEWTKEHDTCLRNAVREYFEKVIPIIIKEVAKIDELVFPDENYD